MSRWSHLKVLCSQIVTCASVWRLVPPRAGSCYGSPSRSSRKTRRGGIVFVQDGRTIQAEKTKIIGDRVRIEKPAETIEIPRSSVLSIYPVTPPTASPNVPPPAEVYRDMTLHVTEKVRREIRERPPAFRGK